MSSAAEAELGALYINASEAVPMRQLLTEMGHKQPKTPIQTDNTTACGVVNNNIQPRRTKAMDMRFHWLRCRDSQGQFRYYWGPGSNNRADYWTKHHCAAHHIEKRTEILKSKFILNALRASIQQTPATSGKGLVKTLIHHCTIEALKGCARYPLPLLAGGLSNLGMEFLSKNTPSIIAGTH